MATPERRTISPAAPVTLTSLPTEILEIIGSHLITRTKPNEPPPLSDLHALVATCRRTHWEFNDKLLYSIDAVDPLGSVALLWGAATGQIKTMERAVRHGADIHREDVVGDLTTDPRNIPPGGYIKGRTLRGKRKESPKRRGTALHFAVKMGQDEAVKWLLDRGARHDVASRGLCHCC